MSILQRSDTTSTVQQERVEDRLLSRLQAAALPAVLMGAGGALGFMLHAGRRNSSFFLMTLMAMWVLSPFLALLWAHIVVSKRWPGPIQATLYGLMLALPLAFLVFYGVDAWRQPRAQPAFIFVVLPPASWLFMVIVILMATYRIGSEGTACFSWQGNQIRGVKRCLFLSSCTFWCLRHFPRPRYSALDPLAEQSVAEGVALVAATRMGACSCLTDRRWAVVGGKVRPRKILERKEIQQHS